MVGGNGLCASPGSLGPNAPMGAYQPIDDPSKDKEVDDVAMQGTLLYTWDRNMQSPADREIIRVCRPPAFKVVKTIEVEAACRQVVAGTNYKVKSTFEVPCSKSNIEKLPVGTSLTRTIITEAYKPLGDGKLQVESVYADDDGGDGGLLGKSGRKMLGGDANDDDDGDFDNDDSDFDNDDDDFDDDDGDFDNDDDDFDDDDDDIDNDDE